jgi:hypothetical protein
VPNQVYGLRRLRGIKRFASYIADFPSGLRTESCPDKPTISARWSELQRFNETISCDAIDFEIAGPGEAVRGLNVLVHERRAALSKGLVHPCESSALFSQAHVHPRDIKR